MLMITNDDLPPHLRDRKRERQPPPETVLELPRDPNEAPDSDAPPKKEPYGTPFLRRD